MSFFEDASLVLIPSGIKDQKIYSVKPTDGTGDLTFSRASTATRVNASGLIEEVAGGVPRLDYLNSTCPKLLLEPQRTNVVPFSEQIDNAAWVKQNITVSPNTQTAPDGTLSADKLIVDNGVAFSSTSNYCRTAALTLTTGVVHTVSVYAKADGFDRMLVRMSTASTMGAGPTISVNVDLITGLQAGGTIGTYIGREAAANGYYRYIFQTTSIASATNYLSFVPSDSTATEGNGVDGISIWGAMLEQGSYQTSYVNTLSTSVTRVADAASKTGISSLIGQTEGTLYLEFSTQPEGLGDARISISDGSAVNWIFLGKDGTQYRALIRASNSLIYSNIDEDILDSSVVKMAIAYKSGEIAYYFNGTLRSSSSSFSFTATLDSLIIGNTNIASVVDEAIKINQLLLFPTRLSNAQLAELTA
jgi:hypothetical protein